MGVAILKQNFRYAATLMISTTTPLHRIEEISEAMAFVQGSSLDITIEVFGIAADADRLRDSFYSWVDRRRRNLSNGRLESQS